MLRVPRVDFAHEVTVFDFPNAKCRSSVQSFASCVIALCRQLSFQKMCEEGEKLVLARREHSFSDGRWEIRVRCRGVVRQPVSVGKHTVRIDDGHVKRREFEHGSVSIARIVDRMSAQQLKDVVQFSNDFA